MPLEEQCSNASPDTSGGPSSYASGGVVQVGADFHVWIGPDERTLSAEDVRGLREARDKERESREVS